MTYAWAYDTRSVSDISTAPIVGAGKERRTLDLTIQNDNYDVRKHPRYSSHLDC